MLLDFRDAEDVVQEAFTRLARTDIAGIDDPEGWLVVSPAGFASTGSGRDSGARPMR